MKLYFYFLDIRKDNCIRMEECDVEEKEKTYRPIKEFPCGYYGCYVRKSDIGKPTGLYQNIIILKEENPQRVAEAFICACQNDISTAKRIIETKENNIKESIDTIEKIEKWRSENAGLRKGISAKLYRWHAHILMTVMYAGCTPTTKGQGRSRRR